MLEVDGAAGPTARTMATRIQVYMEFLGKPLRWTGGLSSTLQLLAGAALLGLYLVSEASLGKDYEIQVKPVPVPTYPAGIPRGQRLAHGVAKCVVSHEDDLGGKVLWYHRQLGRIAAPNITPRMRTALSSSTPLASTSSPRSSPVVWLRSPEESRGLRRGVPVHAAP